MNSRVDDYVTEASRVFKESTELSERIMDLFVGRDILVTSIALEILRRATCFRMRNPKLLEAASRIADVILEDEYCAEKSEAKVNG